MIRVAKGKPKKIVKVTKVDQQLPNTLQALADKYLESMMSAFQSTTNELQNQITFEQVEEAIATGQAAWIINEVDWAAAYEDPLLNEWQPMLTYLVDEAGAATLETLKFKMRFDLLNPHSVDWIRDHAANLVREVSSGTKQAIRSVVQEAFLHGGHPKQQARLIRQMVGLTERQSLAVQHKWIAWREDPTLAHLTDAQIERRVERYARKLHKLRAETIARHETMTAVNQGQAQAIGQARQAGLIDEERARKEWITTVDDRICEFCAPMDGVQVKLDEDFDTPLGTVAHPPMHIQCRCAWGLQFVSE
jgi:SPP1 gp7 family putative phage head morphogenesis protein